MVHIFELEKLPPMASVKDNRRKLPTLSALVNDVADKLGIHAKVHIGLFDIRKVQHIHDVRVRGQGYSFLGQLGLVENVINGRYKSAKNGLQIHTHISDEQRVAWIAASKNEVNRIPN